MFLADIDVIPSQLLNLLKYFDRNYMSFGHRYSFVRSRRVLSHIAQDYEIAQYPTRRPLRDTIASLYSGMCGTQGFTSNKVAITRAT